MEMLLSIYRDDAKTRRNNLAANHVLASWRLNIHKHPGPCLSTSNFKLSSPSLLLSLPRMQEQKSIGVLGNGSWATALVKILTDNGHSVNWWIRNDKSIEYI